MTLVEVVAGLALLGSVLVSLLLAKASLSRQRIEADERLDAIAAADHLLSSWQAEGKPVPRQASGRTGADDRYGWRTHVVHRQRVAGVDIDVVRLEVNQEAHGKEGAERWQTLAEVELLIPPPATKAPEPAKQPAAEAKR